MNPIDWLSSAVSRSIRSGAMLALVQLGPMACAGTPMDFWKTPRHGANCFNEIERRERFTRLDTNDVAVLRRVLDDAHSAGVPVVLTLLSLPGSRWRQHNCGFYATPWAFQVLRPVADARTLYAFHFYEPFAFTHHRNQGRYDYPGPIPTGESEAPPKRDWDRASLRSFLQPVRG